MMLKATIDTDTFRETIEVIAAMVTECRLNISEQGIRTRAVDTANVAMISLELDQEAFASFLATAGELGIDITKMKNIVGMMGKGDVLSLDLPDDGHKMEMIFSGYKYSLTLLDVNTIRKEPNMPSIELPAKIKISGAALNDAIKAAAVVSDKIALGVDPAANSFYMEAEGDSDHIRLELGKDELIDLIPAEARSLFSLDYLKDMGRVMGRADEVEVQIGVDHPVKFRFGIADDNGRVEFLLAPRIEAD
jgi:proliferating cell nuclear antigen